MRNLFFIINLCFLTACGKLQIIDFPMVENTESFFSSTAQLNFQRNTVETQELVPPLIQIWENNYDALPSNGFTAINNWLFFGTNSGHLSVVNLNNGELIGKEDFGGSCSSPPTVYNNIAYQTYEVGEFGLVAYDLKRGEILWFIEGNFSRSSPIATEKLIYHQSLNGQIWCYNYLTGEEIWSASINNTTRNSLALKEGYVISAGAEGNISAFEYTSGILLWHKNLHVPIFSDPVIDGEKIYITSYNGDLYILNSETGEILNHKNFNRPIYIAPSIDKANIYIGLSDGELVVISKFNLENMNSFQGKGPISNPPLITNSYIYVTTLAGNFYILNKTNCQILQEFNLAGRARSTPIIKNGKLVLACEDRRVIAYAEDK